MTDDSIKLKKITYLRDLIYAAKYKDAWVSSTIEIVYLQSLYQSLLDNFPTI